MTKETKGSEDTGMTYDQIERGHYRKDNEEIDVTKTIKLDDINGSGCSATLSITIGHGDEHKVHQFMDNAFNNIKTTFVSEVEAMHGTAS